MQNVHIETINQDVLVYMENICVSLCFCSFVPVQHVLMYLSPVNVSKDDEGTLPIWTLNPGCGYKVASHIATSLCGARFYYNI